VLSSAAVLQAQHYSSPDSDFSRFGANLLREVMVSVINIKKRPTARNHLGPNVLHAFSTYAHDAVAIDICGLKIQLLRANNFLQLVPRPCRTRARLRARQCRKDGF